jgi:alkylation response protein AidB-like acyl-CoA dehydrogenase
MTTTATAEDVDELRSVLRDFLSSQSSSVRVRQVAESADGFDRGLWQRMIDELALPGLAVPIDFGGGGYDGSVQLGVFEELGRCLACVPYLSTVALAIPALLASTDSDVRTELLSALATGARTAAVAFLDADGQFGSPAGHLSARPGDDSHTVTLSGQKSFVVEGCTADVILVPALGDQGVRLYAVDAAADGLTRSPMTTLDLTRPMAKFDFTDAPARLVSDQDASAVIDRMLDFANAATAAEQLGGAQRCLEMSVDFALLREQFGRPIGSFQAIKHKCADMLVAVESARSAVHHLGEVLRTKPADLAIAAPLAKAFCSDAYTFVAAENLHIQGGMGFTWEHDAHLYFRRAQSTAILHGDSGFQRRVLADRLGF